MIDIDQALCALVACDGSDLHLKVGSPPLARIDGDLGPLTDDWPVLEAADTEEALHRLLGNSVRMAEFDVDNEIDLSHEIPGVARFRVNGGCRTKGFAWAGVPQMAREAAENGMPSRKIPVRGACLPPWAPGGYLCDSLNAFRQRGGVSIVARAIPHRIRTIEELALPEVIATLSDEQRGIVLVTGTTGSGKSTTLAAMIHHINLTRAAHIVTIEDPIEFVHHDQRSVISQREVGVDTASFKRALRRVLRQDPDVILIGEMRDEETVQTALSAAETGHLVLSTIHTVDAPESINRMLDFFPPHHHGQVRSMLAGTLRGVISQRLVAAAAGGRIAACEVLRTTGRVRDMIMDPSQTGALQTVIAEGAFYGMQTFDQALYAHVAAGRVTTDEAMRVASSPHDFKLLLDAEGRRGTTMADVPSQPTSAPAPPAADAPLSLAS